MQEEEQTLAIVSQFQSAYSTILEELGRLEEEKR